jgi:hypothetical protein
VFKIEDQKQLPCFGNWFAGKSCINKNKVIGQNQTLNCQSVKPKCNGTKEPTLAGALWHFK